MVVFSCHSFKDIKEVFHEVTEETEVPTENHRLTLSHWQLSHIPGQDSNLGSSERQLAVSGNTLDHSAIRSGPSSCREHRAKLRECLPDATHVQDASFRLPACLLVEPAGRGDLSHLRRWQNISCMQMLLTAARQQICRK